MITKTRAWIGSFIVLAVICGAVIVVAMSGLLGPGAGWIDVGSLPKVQAAGVQRIPHEPIFLVPHRPLPIALSASAQHIPGEQVMYCRASGFFESRAHGEKFDSYGDYILGPGSRGMDYVGMKILDGEVYVNPGEIITGHPRGYFTPGAQRNPIGPFCV